MSENSAMLDIKYIGLGVIASSKYGVRAAIRIKDKTARWRVWVGWGGVGWGVLNRSGITG